MGIVIDVSPKLSVELRKESYWLHPQVGDSVEYHYDTVFALEAVVREIKTSERFTQWLERMERKR